MENYGLIQFPVWSEEITAVYLKIKTGNLSEIMIQNRIKQAKLGEESVVVQWIQCYVGNKNPHLSSPNIYLSYRKSSNWKSSVEIYFLPVLS